MNEEQKPPPKLDASEVERDIRSDRKFTLAEAIGRMGGPDMMKGASPVTRKRQAELEIKHYLNRHLVDVEGALQVVLLRRVTESRALLEAGYEQPIVVMGGIVRRLLQSETLLRTFVGDVDRQWGHANQERPHFEREAQPPHPDDPYTLSSVRSALSGLLEKLPGG
jgi:hypothetical protein